MKVHSPRVARTAAVVPDGGTQGDLIGDPPAGGASALCGVRDFEMADALPADPAAVARARRRLHALVCDSGLSAIADDVALAAGELMANAVNHGCPARSASCFTVRASCRRGLVRVEVQDASADQPCLRTADDDQEGGRGLHLVDALVDRWGVAPGPLAGKTVWLELDVDVAVLGVAS
uniref:Histidine kinase/HSP90-like ATPase domain-containing protein n=1 Tax=Streptomyces sp. F12 TaxID=1436084 RepID=V9Z4J1_9ACTN|nr:ATP-binding protein [Streptomyces sp. F12]AHE40380.1 Hypothetical protein pFRL6_293c [Streptomyces sp. F12]